MHITNFKKEGLRKTHLILLWITDIRMVTFFQLLHSATFLFCYLEFQDNREKESRQYRDYLLGYTYRYFAEDTTCTKKWKKNYILIIAQQSSILHLRSKNDLKSFFSPVNCLFSILKHWLAIPKNISCFAVTLKLKEHDWSNFKYSPTKNYTDILKIGSNCTGVTLLPPLFTRAVCVHALEDQREKIIPYFFFFFFFFRYLISNNPQTILLSVSQDMHST